MRVERFPPSFSQLSAAVFSSLALFMYRANSVPSKVCTRSYVPVRAVPHIHELSDGPAMTRKKVFIVCENAHTGNAPARNIKKDQLHTKCLSVLTSKERSE